MLFFCWLWAIFSRDSCHGGCVWVTVESVSILLYREVGWMSTTSHLKLVTPTIFFCSFCYLTAMNNVRKNLPEYWIRLVCLANSLETSTLTESRDWVSGNSSRWEFPKGNHVTILRNLKCWWWSWPGDVRIHGTTMVVVVRIQFFSWSRDHSRGTRLLWHNPMCTIRMWHVDE